MISSIKYNKNDLYQILGRISVAFATMDFYVTILIRNSTIDKVNFLHDMMALGKKLRILKGFKSNQFKDPSLYKKLHNILPEALRVSADRNQYIHDHWVFNEDTISVGEIELMHFQGLDKEEVKTTSKKIQISDLKDFYSEIRQLHEKFGQLLIIARYPINR